MLKRFLLRRMIHTLLLLLSVSGGSFLLLELAPGNFLTEAKLNPQLSPQTLAALHDRLGLDRSLPERYLYWLKSATQGDFGISFAYNMPVSVLIWPRMRSTLLLTATSLGLAWSIALPLGVWAAARKGSSLDRLLVLLTSGLLSIPELVLACGLLIVAAKTAWLRIGGLPLAVCVLAPASLPLLLRHIRAGVLTASGASYVRAARAHGISEGRLWFRHVLPAASHSLISLFGLSVAGLLSSSLLVEVVVGWPGLGPLFLEAVAARDFYIVAGVVFLSANFLAVGNLLADLLLYYGDPRIRMT